MKKTIKIFDVSYQGAGVGKADGKIVFVPKTLPDEVVEIEVDANSKSFSNGKLLNVEVASKRREKAVCPYFEICGGCTFQNCDKEYEKELKTKILRSELKKVGFQGEIEFCESEKRFAYRNKIKLAVQNNRIGYFKPKSHEFFEIECCPIASEKINSSLDVIKEFLSVNEFRELQNVYIKQVDEKIAICFLFDKNAKIDIKKCKNLEILSNFSVFFAFGRILEDNNTKVFCVLGNEKLKKNIGDFEMDVDVSAFNQVNDFVAKKMYDKLVLMSAGKRVVNAYSGQGLLTFMLSKQAKFVYGIEYQSSAHQSALKLEELQEKYCMKSVCGKVEDELSKILASDMIDLMIVDPAREGCQKSVLEEVEKSKIPEFVYVSCDFATLTRDLKILTKTYQIDGVQIFNMFPCTCKMECLVKLSRTP